MDAKSTYFRSVVVFGVLMVGGKLMGGWMARMVMVKMVGGRW